MSGAGIYSGLSLPGSGWLTFDPGMMADFHIFITFIPLEIVNSRAIVDDAE